MELRLAARPYRYWGKNRQQLAGIVHTGQQVGM